MPTALKLDIVLVLAALLFDVLSDRSFGATMLAVLPIALISGGCLLVGPWLENQTARTAALGWIYGILLIVFISIGFALSGVEQARTAEIVFTYASLLAALPASLLIPLISAAGKQVMPDAVIARMLLVSVLVSALAFAQWKVCSIVRTMLQRRK